jgi:hypothetical protein
MILGFGRKTTGCIGRSSLANFRPFSGTPGAHEHRPPSGRQFLLCRSAASGQIGRRPGPAEEVALSFRAAPSTCQSGTAAGCPGGEIDRVTACFKSHFRAERRSWTVPTRGGRERSGRAISAGGSGPGRPRLGSLPRGSAPSSLRSIATTGDRGWVGPGNSILRLARSA